MYVDIPIICTDTVINGFQEVIGGRLCYDGMVLVSTTTDDGRGVELSVDDSDVDRDCACMLVLVHGIVHGEEVY